MAWGLSGLRVRAGPLLGASPRAGEGRVSAKVCRKATGLFGIPGRRAVSRGRLI